MASLAVLKPLLAAMKDGDPLVRTAAAEALALQQSPEAVAGLVGGLKDRELKVRAAAATALGRLGHEEAVPPLLAALNDKEWQVRAEALESLGRLGFRSALEAVTARLNDPDVEVRQKAADAVASLGHEESIAALLPNLVDLDAGVRQATQRALGKISANWERASCVQAMVSKLQAAARHSDSGVQYAAVTLLKRITGLAVSELTHATERTKAERRHQLRVRNLSGLLRDRDARVRLAAAEMIGRLRLSACADALRQGLQDPDCWVQAAVRDALKTLPVAQGQSFA
jgi:HEAT repeat protein